MSENTRGLDKRPRKRNPHPDESYALAERCVEMKRRGLTRQQIAEAVGKSYTHVSNLIRNFESTDLHPDIRAAWKARNPLATTDRLNKMRGLSLSTQPLVWEIDRLSVEGDQAGLDRIQSLIERVKVGGV